VLVEAPGHAQRYLLGDPFTFARDFFPVRGPHGYGGPGDRFGAGRAGHSHQGQDILAPCGTPVVAARGGVVKDADFQWAAGNYVVIDAAGSGADFFYAHLREPARVHPGQVVVTGQRLGDVGESGDATACHLHLELWTGPGWYSGGQPFDPWRSIQLWDRQTGAGRAPR
jgi:murein DD-endopeptidase MepM/ murein hydrolase activator NlpD